MRLVSQRVVYAYASQAQTGFDVSSINCERW